ncbi:MAG: hypothetical protein B7C24_09845 [Bacteroidetes bacterium 4572_77]|nr:MAG: hypothetical protein B7C24_09845 [Bacteroidetes bacterium 4572_77]
MVVNAQINGNNNTGILAGNMYSNSSAVKCSTSGLINTTESNIGGLVGAASSLFVDSCFSTVTINATGTELVADVGGLIGQLNSGTIVRSGVEADISASNYKSVGALIGFCAGSTVELSRATGSLEGEEMIGGFIGYGSYCTFDSCFTDASVHSTGSACGGFGGFLNNCEINDTYSFGDVSSTGYGDIGGFAGLTSFSNYRQSFSNSKVESSSTYTGGFIGEAQQGTVIGNCYATGAVHCIDDYAGGFIGLSNTVSNIFNCYSTGKVSGTGIKGGFAGYNSYGPIIDCFWDVESSENTIAVGYNAGDIPQYLSGKNTSEMKDVITFTNLAGGELSESWDFVDNPYNDESDDDIWDIHPDVNNGYAYLSAVFPPEITNSIFQIYDSNKENETQLFVYPNPWSSSQDNINLTLKSVRFESGNYTVSLIDVYGRICQQEVLLIQGNSICAGETHFSFYFKNKQIESGIYFVVLRKQSKIISRVKLVVYRD